MCLGTLQRKIQFRVRVTSALTWLAAKNIADPSANDDCKQRCSLESQELSVVQRTVSSTCGPRQDLVCRHGT